VSQLRAELSAVQNRCEALERMLMERQRGALLSLLKPWVHEALRKIARSIPPHRPHAVAENVSNPTHTPLAGMVDEAGMDEALAVSRVAMDQYKRIRQDYRQLLGRRAQNVVRTANAPATAKKVRALPFTSLASHLHRRGSSTHDAHVRGPVTRAQRPESHSSTSSSRSWSVRWSGQAH